MIKNEKRLGDNTYIIFILGIGLFLMFGLMVFLAYERISNQQIGIWEGLMSIQPKTILTANFTPSSPKIGENIVFSPQICDTIINKCVPCPNCSLKKYSELNGQKNFEEILVLNESGEVKLNFDNDPIWIYIIWPQQHLNLWVRIPEPNFWQVVEISYNEGWLNKIAMFIFFIGIIMIIYSTIKGVIKFVKKLVEIKKSSRKV